MGPLSRALADLSAQVAALISTRLELFGLEARDAGERLLCRLAALLAAAIFLLLALLVASLALALVFWPTEYRFWALGLLALLYAVLGAGLACWLVCRLRRDPDPFAVTAEVLREDEAGLRAVLSDGLEPDESERHAGRDVDAGLRAVLADGPVPDESERHAGRDVDAGRKGGS